MFILQDYPQTTLLVISMFGALFSCIGLFTSLFWTKSSSKKSSPRSHPKSKETSEGVTKNTDSKMEELSSEKEFFSRFEEIPQPFSNSAQGDLSDDQALEKEPDVISLAKKMDEEKNKEEKI